MNKALTHVTLSLLLLTAANTAVAQDMVSEREPLLSDELEDDGLEDIPFEMEDSAFESPEPGSAARFSQAWFKQQLIAPAHFTYRHELAYGIEQPQQLVINRSSLRLQWQKGQDHYFLRFDGKTDVDFVYNDSDFNQDVKNKYRNQSDIREFYVQASKGPYSIKLGRQLVIWGKADGAVVTDIMSPRDLTESVFTLVEDARIGQSMIVADLYLGAGIGQAQQQWSLIVNPNIKVNELPIAGHPYGFDWASGAGLLPDAGQAALSIIDNKPDTSWKRPEIGLRWNVSVDKVDWSIMAAEVHEDNPVLLLSALDLSQGKIKTDYPRYQMLGGGFNWGAGNFVWKGEIAFKKNRRFNRDDQYITSQHNVRDLALGFDYNANGAYTLSLEFSNQHIIDWRRQLLNVRRNESVLYGIWNKTWLNEALTTQYTTSIQLQDKESFHRIEFQYELSDQWSAELQLDYFDSEDQDTALGRLNDKHRICLQIDYDF